MVREHRVHPCKMPPSIASERRSPRNWQRVVATRLRSKGSREPLNVGEILPVSLVQKSQAKRQIRPKSCECYGYEALEITLHCCRTGGIADYCSGTAANLAISQIQIV